MEKEKKTIYDYLAYIIVFGIIGFIIFYKDPTDAPVKKEEKIEEKTRTILIYTAPANLETDNGHASFALNSIDKNKFDTKNNNIVVMAGGANYWHNGFSKDPKIYEYKDGKYEIVDNCYGYKSMGDAETLKYFFNYVDKNYDTDEYILYFYGHGSGVGGFMFDEVYDDLLDLKETLLSFAGSNFFRNKDSRTGKTKKLDLIIFNSCIMATTELVNSIEVYSDYAIFSEEYTWSIGNKSPLVVFNDMKATDNIVDIGKNFIDNYYSYATAEVENTTHQMSMVDLFANTTFILNVESLFSKIDLNKEYQNILRIRGNMKQLGDDSLIDEVDLYDLMNSLKTYDYESFKKFEENFNKLVIYNKSNDSRLHGVSIFFPYINDGNDLYEKINTSIFQFDVYTKFTDAFIEKQKGDYGYDMNPVS